MPTTTPAPATASTVAVALIVALAPGPSRADPPEEEQKAAEAPKVDEASLGEEIVVTATRSPRPLRDVPANVTVVNRDELERSATKTVDELLQAVPSFNTFRRASSISADPSSEGVSLRGVGPSATSRSLVLVDGIPANDPFGDWVYWRAMPPIGIQRIEVVPGGGSALYGNYALAGVMQVFSRPITPSTLDGVAEAGSFDTWRLGTWASDRWGPVGAAVEGDLLGSQGYYVVAPYARGPIDTTTPTQHAVGSGRVEVQAARDLTLTLRGGYFYENYNGGTKYTTSMVRRGEYAASARWEPGEAGTFDLAVFGHVGDFEQNRARVNSDRSHEDQSAHQEVPTNDVAASALWRSQPLALGGTHTLTVGTDARWIYGVTQESLYPPPPPPPPATSVAQQDSGGRQRLFGIFAEDVYDVTGAVEVVAALRYDHWENVDASLSQRQYGGATLSVAYPTRSYDQLSPKLGVRVRPLDWLTLRAAGYRAFRAPTLNELYRSFQVGTIRTFGNPDLSAETLRGAEAGVVFDVPRGFSVRMTGYWNQLDDPVLNVTCPIPGVPTGIPGTTCTGPNRQKQNLGTARIRGIEAGADWQIAPHWSVGAAYTFVDSRVTDAPGNPQLVGKELPQDPRNRASLSASFDDPRLLTVNAQLIYIGQQYEDDLNNLPMGEVFLVDVFAAWHVARFLDLYAAVQNLFDKTYLVGRAGVDTVGQPRFIHGGVRVAFGG
jgi:outer membrane receptor protein involved in Fe transport